MKTIKLEVATKQVILLFLAVCLAGCNTPRWQNSTDFNTRLPSELASRAVLRSGGVNVYNLSNVVGRIFVYNRDTNGGVFFSDDDFVSQFPNVKANDLPIQNAIRYQAKVDASMAFSGSYLTATASLGVSNTMEVVVSDIAAYEDPSIPEDSALENQIPAAWKSNPTNRFVYVYGATLSSIIYKGYISVTAGEDASGGAFSAKGNVYASSGSFVADYIIGINYKLIGGPRMVGTDRSFSREQLLKDKARWLTLPPKVISTAPDN